MPLGKLEVLLVNAKGLDNSDFLSSMDPYVHLTCRTQEQKSSVSTDTTAESLLYVRYNNCITPMPQRLPPMVDHGGSDVRSLIAMLKTQSYFPFVIYTGSNPEWNETFIFNVSGDVSELHLKVMDKDTFTADDFVGEAKIPLAGVFEEGNLPPTPYTVVKDGEFKGEIRVGLTFIKERGHAREYQAEEFGGWKQSSF